MRIKPEVDYRFSPPNELVRPILVLVVYAKFGEDRRRIADAIVWDIYIHTHTYIQTEKPTCAADIIIYHFFANLANVVDN